jgi:hypothetical protein
MPSDVLDALEDLIGSTTPRSPGSSKGQVLPNKKSMRLLASGGSSNNSVGSKESISDGVGSGRRIDGGNKKQSTTTSNLVLAEIPRSFSFHDPFMKPKEDHNLQPSKEQLKRLQSVDKNLQLIHRQFSEKIHNGEDGGEIENTAEGVHSRYSSPVKKHLQPKDTTIDADDDLDDLISGNYIEKIRDNYEPTSNHALPVEGMHRKNLHVSTTEDFGKLCPFDGCCNSLSYLFLFLIRQIISRQL